MSILASKGSKTTTTSSIAENRNKIRGLLRKASHGNVYAFTQVSAFYFEILSEYFYLLGFVDPRDRLFEIRNLLADCWKYLPYTKRVSDFERFLQIHLEQRNSDACLDVGEPHQRLNKLDHQLRFLLVTRVFGHWSYKSLQLALRCKKSELSSSLMTLKAEVTGFKPQMLKTHEQLQILRLSDLLEGELSQKAALKLEKEIAKELHVLQFKADWLSYRCELVELQQKMKLTSEQAEELKRSISEQLKEEPMEHPKLSDNIINQFSFVRFPSRILRS